MEKKEIEIGGTYFYNNRPVQVLRFETEDFVFVRGANHVSIDLKGDDFCEFCPVSKSFDRCDDTDCDRNSKIITAVLDELTGDIFFYVFIKELHKEPFEYGVWKKLQAQNKELEKKNSELRESIGILKKENEQSRKLNQDIVESFNALETVMERKKQELIVLEKEIEKQKQMISSFDEEAKKRGMPQRVPDTAIRHLELD